MKIDSGEVVDRLEQLSLHSADPSYKQAMYDAIEFIISIETREVTKLMRQTAETIREVERDIRSLMFSGTNPERVE